MAYKGKLYGLIEGEYVELRDIAGTFDVMATETDKRFEKFWKYYGKVGNRKLALIQWNKLSDKQIEEIRHNVVGYVKVTTPQFRKSAQSYLNPKTEFWNDVVIDRRPEADVGFEPHIDTEKEKFSKQNNEVEESVFDDLIKDLKGGRCESIKIGKL